MRKLFLLLMGVVLLAGQAKAQRTITGKVTDASGNPLPNVSVLVKNTNSGTLTNTDGTFTLSLTADAKTLVFSSVDMESKELSIGSQTFISTSLKATDKSLQEVVVTGYQNIRKIDLTGSVATVKGKDIENLPFSSVDKALQGAVAGLQSVASSGQPGASQAILIRGVSSITASNAPLWVVDGIPVNSGDASRLQTTANLLSTMNPNDIESISVLKDAASTAIYGSRGANGVIIITTKKGRAGKTRIRFDTEVGTNSTAYTNDKYRPLNAQEYFDITREGLVNAGVSATTITNTLNGRGLGNGIDFNWLEGTTRQGTQQQFNLSAEGGNDKTTFYTSAGYFKQEGTTINSKLDRINGALRVNHKINERISFGMNLNGGFVNQRAPLSGGAFGNPVLSSYFLLPSRTAYNPDGSYNLVASSLGGLHNTIALSEIDKRFLREFSLRGNFNAEYKILKNLQFKTSLSGDFNMLEEDQYNNPFHGDGAASSGRAFAYYTRYMNKVWTNTLNWQQNINKSGDIKFISQVGYESQASRGYFSSLRADAFPQTLLLTYPASGATPVTTSASISDYTFLSTFGSTNFNFKDRYILSGSFRRDGSSRFSDNFKFGDFWSVGASWNVDKERFMNNIGFISQLKLRASYGRTGNAGIGNYEALPSYAFGANYNGQPGSTPGNVGNPNLTWEINEPFDLGIDIGILKNRVNLTVDYYNRETEALLLDVPLSLTTGFSTATRNIGSMENKGLEITLNTIPVQTSNFTWTVDFNFSKNKNKVISLPGGNDIISGVFMIREGVAINSFYVREYAGVNPANGDPLWYVDGTHAATTNNYNTAQRQVIGNSLPKYFGSLSNTFTYKGFSLDAQLYYNYGNLVRDTWGSFYLSGGANAVYNKVARSFERWTTPGQITQIPKWIDGGNKSFQSFSTFYLNQGDFIRLRNIQLGYTLPQNVVSRLKISNATFYVRGTNLWTWVKDKNLPFDPEQGTGSASNLNVFIPKTITAGLNLSF